MLTSEPIRGVSMCSSASAYRHSIHLIPRYCMHCTESACVASKLLLHCSLIFVRLLPATFRSHSELRVIRVYKQAKTRELWGFTTSMLPTSLLSQTMPKAIALTSGSSSTVFGHYSAAFHRNSRRAYLASRCLYLGVVQRQLLNQHHQPE